MNQVTREDVTLPIDPLLSRTFTGPPAAVLIFDKAGTVVSCNPFCTEIFGYAQEEMIGRHFQELLPQTTLETNNQPQFETVIKPTLPEDDFPVFQIQHQKKDRTVFDAIATVVHLRSASKSEQYHCYIVRNLSTVDKLQKEIASKMTQLAHIYEMDDIFYRTTSPRVIYDAILVAITSAHGLGFNRAFLLLVDESSQALKGEMAIGPSSAEEAHNIYYDLVQHPKPLSQIIDDNEQMIGKKDLYVNKLVRELSIPLSDTDNILIETLNQQRFFEITPELIQRAPEKYGWLKQRFGIDALVITPLIWHNRPIGMIIVDNCFTHKKIKAEDINMLTHFASMAANVIQNITLYETLEKKIVELQKAYRLLEESQAKLIQKEKLAIVGELTAEIAHEIRTPLTTIGGFSRRIMKELSDKDKNYQYLKIIVDETKNMEETLQSILNYLKKRPVVVAKNDINETLKSALELHEPEIQSTHVETHLHLDGNIPMFLYNRNQMRRVFSNLISNALAAMPTGGKLTITSYFKGGDIVVLVSDTGKGIAPEHLGSVFSPYFTTKKQGVGLGLSVVKQVVDSFGGTIDVTSRVGEGTSFKLVFPIPREAEPDETPPS